MAAALKAENEVTWADTVVTETEKSTLMEKIKEGYDWVSNVIGCFLTCQKEDELVVKEDLLDDDLLEQEKTGKASENMGEETPYVKHVQNDIDEVPETVQQIVPALLCKIVPSLLEMVKPEFNEVVQPELNEIVIPEFNEVVQPELNEVVQPELNEVVQPELNEVVQPELNEVVQPELNEVVQPELNEVEQPELNEVVQPELNEVVQPELNEVVQPDLNKVVLPKINQMVPPLILQNRLKLSYQNELQISNETVLQLLCRTASYQSQMHESEMNGGFEKEFKEVLAGELDRGSVENKPTFVPHRRNILIKKVSTLFAKLPSAIKGRSGYGDCSNTIDACNDKKNKEQKKAKNRSSKRSNTPKSQ